MKTERNLLKVDMHAIYELYKPQEDDDERMLLIKKAVSELDEVGRRIIYLYAELGSQKKVAALLNVSTVTVGNYIKKIRKEIKDKL